MVLVAKIANSMAAQIHRENVAVICRIMTADFSIEGRLGQVSFECTGDSSVCFPTQDEGGGQACQPIR
jgi:hypothetical protein